MLRLLKGMNYINFLKKILTKILNKVGENMKQDINQNVKQNADKNMSKNAKQKIILSTGNRDKVKELANLIDADRFELLTKKDFSVEDIDFEETGDTLEENATIKAIELKKLLEDRNENIEGAWILADDTGLFVAALNGQPGVYSSRYAGENVTYEDNVNKLLYEMSGIEEEKRTAYFETVIVLLRDGKINTFSGRVNGSILDEKRGESGFGYDPVFYVTDKNKTLAEMSLEEKNQISHRAAAYGKLAEYLM